MNSYLIDLLLASPKTQIPTHLKYSEVLLSVEFILTHLIESVRLFFVEKKFSRFDPHVGETSCQIRGYQLQLLTQYITLNAKYTATNRLQFLNTILHKIQSESANYIKLDSCRRDKNPTITSLEDFLNSSAYNLKLSPQEVFLVQAYILSKYKVTSPNGDPGINFENLMLEAKVSKTLAKRLIRFYQINLSEISCQFIASLLDDMPEISITKEFLEALKNKDDDNRSVLPCYVVMYIILEHMKRRGCAIQFIIDREHKGLIKDQIFLNFHASTKGIKHATDTKLQEPCYTIYSIVKYQTVLESNSSFIMRFLTHGAENIIMGNMAIHPQYSGNKLKFLSDNPFKLDHNFKETVNISKKFLSNQREAIKFGLGLNNPSLLYIKHIYCDKNMIEYKVSQPNAEQPWFINTTPAHNYWSEPDLIYLQPA